METKTLSSAIKKVAISYILIYLHINISVIDILPDWLGYFLKKKSQHNCSNHSALL